jgi:hypothetical protein
MVTTRRALALGALAGAVTVVVIGWATGFSLGELGTNRAKAAIAFVALILSVREARRLRAGKPVARWAPPAAAAFLAAMAIGAYYNFGNPVYEGIFHRNNVFHHFLGAKYAGELGYTRLYSCVAVAQSELGPEEADDLRTRRMRDLEADDIAFASTALERPERCKDRFTPERWTAFVADVRFFRSTADRAFWDEMQLDHGFNAPPVWTSSVHLLTSNLPATRGVVLALASLDVLLCAAAFAALAWAFGWRTACLAMIFWGCQHPANHLWVSGSLLRHDWFFWLLLSVAFLKKRRFVGAGIAFAAATSLRLFPLVLLAGPAVVVALHLLRTRSLRRSHVRFIAGGALGAVLLLGTSVAVLGTHAYSDFAAHIRVHERTPAANHMGLRALFMVDYDGSSAAKIDPSLPDPLRPWREARIAQYEAHKPIFVAGALALLVPLFFVLRRRRSLWPALALSVVALYALLQLASYYFAALILPVVLARVRPPIERIVLATLGVGALVVTMPAFSATDEHAFATQSVIWLAYCVALVVVMSPRSRLRLEELP